MSFNVAAIDGKLFWNRTCRRHLLKDALPDTAAGPSVVAVVDRGRRAIGGWHVAPAAPRLEDMKDAGDDPAIIDTRLARFAVREMRLDRRPSLVGKPE